MTPPHPTSPILLVHILKTAGTTLRAVIRQNIRPGELWDLRGTPGPQVDRLVEELQGGGTTVRCITGHVGMGLDGIVPGGVRTVTVLRDPVARFVSHYHHARRTPSAWLHEPAAELPLDRFVASDAGRALANLQTAFLAGPRPEREADAAGHPEGWEERYRSARAPEVLGVGRPLRGTTDPGDVDAALANLERLELVGLTEQLDETLLLARAALGWKRIHMTRLGASPRPPEQLAPDVLGAIRDLNDLDVRLYEAAVRRFEADLARTLPDLSDQLRRHRRGGLLRARASRLSGRLRSGLTSRRGVPARPLDALDSAVDRPQDRKASE